MVAAGDSRCARGQASGQSSAESRHLPPVYCQHRGASDARQSISGFTFILLPFENPLHQSAGILKMISESTVNIPKYKTFQCFFFLGNNERFSPDNKILRVT